MQYADIDNSRMLTNMIKSNKPKTTSAYIEKIVDQATLPKNQSKKPHHQLIVTKVDDDSFGTNEHPSVENSIKLGQKSADNLIIGFIDGNIP